MESLDLSPLPPLSPITPEKETTSVSFMSPEWQYDSIDYYTQVSFIINYMVTITIHGTSIANATGYSRLEPLNTKS